MPYIDIRLAGIALTPERRTALVGGLTHLIATELRKRRELVAVSIAQLPAEQWAIAGQTLDPQDGIGVYVEMKVTAGTNTAAEKAAMIGKTSDLLKRLFGALPTASYVAIHEIDADAWGYDGLPQAARRSVREPR